MAGRAGQASRAAAQAGQARCLCVQNIPFLKPEEENVTFLYPFHGKGCHCVSTLCMCLVRVWVRTEDIASRQAMAGRAWQAGYGVLIVFLILAMVVLAILLLAILTLASFNIHIAVVSYSSGTHSQDSEPAVGVLVDRAS